MRRPVNSYSPPVLGSAISLSGGRTAKGKPYSTPSAGLIGAAGGRRQLPA